MHASDLPSCQQLPARLLQGRLWQEPRVPLAQRCQGARTAKQHRCKRYHPAEWRGGLSTYTASRWAVQLLEKRQRGMICGPTVVPDSVTGQWKSLSHVQAGADTAAAPAPARLAITEQAPGNDRVLGVLQQHQDGSSP